MKKVDLNDVIIGRNIKKYAKIKNITLQALADEIGVGCAAMSNWVNGKRPVSAYILYRISNVLKIDIEKFFEGVACCLSRETDMGSTGT